MELVGLWRYPVRSLQGERVDSASSRHHRGHLGVWSDVVRAGRSSVGDRARLSA